MLEKSLKIFTLFHPHLHRSNILMQSANRLIHSYHPPNFLKYLMVAIMITKDHGTRSLGDKVRPVKLAICPVRTLSSRLHLSIKFSTVRVYFSPESKRTHKADSKKKKKKKSDRNVLSQKGAHPENILTAKATRTKLAKLSIGLLPLKAATQTSADP